MLQFSHAGLEHGALLAEQLQPPGNGLIALHGQLDVFADVLEGHAGLFQALDDAQPLEVLLRKNADAAGRAPDEGKQPFLIVIADRRCGHAQPPRHLPHCIGHVFSSYDLNPGLTCVSV